ncbi:hypothetical protein NKJ28_00325 [Mesorhizobium sp. M0145]|uniref:hypothetical protein n=1 Tax=Mesorhizobium sp. M0145 TaxID=2956895 RepID=UPI003336F1AF
MSSGKALTAEMLADALGCFWNAAIGDARDKQDSRVLAVASSVAEGFAAVERRLREHAQPAPTSAMDGVKWATCEDKEIGWRLDPKFIEQIAKEAEDATGYDATWEIVEHVYLAALSKAQAAPTSAMDFYPPAVGDPLPAPIKESIGAVKGAVVKALEDAEDTLRLVERPALRDPQHGDEVEALGLRIGFGALMSSASASWREHLATKGNPVGGEFVAGPCHGTVVSTLAKLRSALAAPTPELNGETVLLKQVINPLFTFYRSCRYKVVNRTGYGFLLEDERGNRATVHESFIVDEAALIPVQS